MTQTLELTAAELELIENQRKQIALDAEAKAIRDAIKLEKDITEAWAAIKKEQASEDAQVEAATEFYKKLKKLNSKYKLIQEDKEVIRQIKGDYLPNTKYEREVLKEIKYTSISAHIILEETPFKIEVKKHLVYSNSWSSRAEDKGYKMHVIGGGFYDSRLMTNPKSINKKIEDKQEEDRSRAEAKLIKANALEYVFDKLTTQYPEATITTGTEWQRNNWSKTGGEMIDIINISLSNNIKMKFRVFPDKSLSRMEITFPVRDSYQLIDEMNRITLSNNK